MNSEVEMKTNDIVSPVYLAIRRDCAVAAKRAGNVGELMREFAWVGLRFGRARMMEMAREVNSLARAK